MAGNTGALPWSTQEWPELVARETAHIKRGQRYVRGLFAGGTFCYQAQQILQDAGLVVHSNVPLPGNVRLDDANHSVAHTLVDMGSDEFTQGRPHPMIDSSLRRERILAEAQDPEVAILLLDFILGYNAAPDPAGELAEAIGKARALAVQRGRYLSIIASVCGTEGDPQDLARQCRVLMEAGAIVLPSSAQAARLCATLAASLQEATDGQPSG